MEPEVKTRLDNTVLSVYRAGPRLPSPSPRLTCALVAALQALYDDVANYIRINHLGGPDDNQVMFNARQVLDRVLNLE